MARRRRAADRRAIITDVLRGLVDPVEDFVPPEHPGRGIRARDQRWASPVPGAVLS
ncbi:MAG TPA: hypothetical protein VMT70_09200 [Vicinamibacteria bacterium]|nr:hypothetical protein [Vicinamibacteria bacterium]